jgi:hypothetical protein
MRTLPKIGVMDVRRNQIDHPRYASFGLQLLAPLKLSRVKICDLAIDAQEVAARLPKLVQPIGVHEPRCVVIRGDANRCQKCSIAIQKYLRRRTVFYSYFHHDGQ